ncbi:Uncharacterized protein BP5553_06498 [Venustampulla echinocandica]|uniref:Rhodopsin domain-containing protein n=1 Tax=Venustampulla echinocandica TaxID=2656787 RepID=A0A370TK37_9HELO|nr:Uncharacterized protein BP5553_06498 [Venustampulla echinocandica]RDL35886.1 Uncharacterized protein BP5553_06498 [Venustampulla echinocandica]
MGVEQLQGVYVSGVPHGSPGAMRVWLILVVSWMAILALLCVVLRLVSRRIKKQKLWWDDYLILFSMVWNWVVVGIGFAMFIEGTGYHAWQLPAEATINIERWLLVTEIIYFWNMCWTKLSLLFMYYRIFHFRYFKVRAIVVGSFVVIWAITASFLYTFICVPVHKLWKPDIPGHCISQLGVWMANSSATIFSDILILCLPMPQVWKLQLKMIEKITVTLVFSLGFFAVFASAFRTWVLFNYSKNDVPYTLTPLLVWSDIEMCVGIISACLPTLLPVVTIAATKLNLSRALKLTRNTVSPSGSRQPYASSKGTSSHLRTIDGGELDLEDMRDRVHSKRRSDSDPFYRLPDVSKSDNIFANDQEDIRDHVQSKCRSDDDPFYRPDISKSDNILVKELEVRIKICNSSRSYNKA